MDFGRPWYHGSPLRLTTLRAGSSVSQNRDVARAFSHRPGLVSQGTEGIIKHDGSLSGFLYLVAEEVSEDDLYPHPHPVNIGQWEWLTRRDLALTLLEATAVDEATRLTSDEIAELRRKQAANGAATFAEPQGN